MKKLALILPFVLAACVNPDKVSETKITDANISCEQIVNENAQIAGLKKEAKKGTGASGANIAAVIIFWPVAVANYVNGQEALEAAHKREATLARLAQAKNCWIAP